MKSLSNYFRKKRFNKKNHLGVGDITLSISEQDEICDIAAEMIVDSINAYSKNIESKITPQKGGLFLIDRNDLIFINKENIDII